MNTPQNRAPKKACFFETQRAIGLAAVTASGLTPRLRAERMIAAMPACKPNTDVVAH
jgi:hypothetical protein